VVTLVEFGDTRIMLAADAELVIWEQILKKYAADRLRCNVLKVGHHGSRNAMSRELARALSRGKCADTVAIVAPSFGYGLPDEETLGALREVFGEVRLSCAVGGPVAGAKNAGLSFPGALGVRPLPRSRQTQTVVEFDHLGNRNR